MAARTLALCSHRRRCHRRQPAARCTPAPNHPVSASPPPNEPLVRSDPAACVARRDSGARREQRRRSATAPAACRKPARTHLRRGDEVVQVHDLQRAGEILRHGWQARCRDQLPRVTVSGRTSGRQARQRPQGQRRHRLRVDIHRASERRAGLAPAGSTHGHAKCWCRWRRYLGTLEEAGRETRAAASARRHTHTAAAQRRSSVRRRDRSGGARHIGAPPACGAARGGSSVGAAAAGMPVRIRLARAAGYVRRPIYRIRVQVRICPCATAASACSC